MCQGNEILRWAEKLGPLIQEAIPFDCALSIADKEKFIFFLPAKTFVIPDTTGKPIPEGRALYRAIKEGRKMSQIVPREIHGVTFNAIALPLKGETGEIVGGVSLAMTLDVQHKLCSVAETLAASLEQISATTTGLAHTATTLAESVTELHKADKEVIYSLDKTGDILSFINNIASNSNLLGLNAAIEAARAGEHGRGFSVVAEEIRKMAENSVRAVANIQTIINNIRAQSEKMGNQISELSTLSEQQATAAGEISVTLQQIATVSQEVEKVALEMYSR